MEKSHRNILRSNRMALCQAMESGIFIDHLGKCNVLTKIDLDILSNIPLNQKKNEKLLDILPKRGPKAFIAFSEALKSCKLAHLIGIAEEAESKNLLDRVNHTMAEQKAAQSLFEDEKAQQGIMHDTPQDKSSFDKEEDSDINQLDPVGKVAKVEDTNLYDIPDTPAVSDHSNGTAKDQHVMVCCDRLQTENRGEPPLNMEVRNSHGQDFTDAPSNASSENNENADGPFGKRVSQKTAETPSASGGARSHIEYELTNCYPMKTLPRGYFLLINNKDFLPESTMQNYPRNGTDVDANAIQELFEELGYVVESHRNLNKYEMRSVCQKVSKFDFRPYSAFACCILSHGKEGKIYGTDGEIDIKELTRYFREENLAGKPKIFIFQACQGSDYMDAVMPDGVSEVDGGYKGGEDKISLPTEADFIYAYSTVPGYYSWRNSVRGSWFIQGIVEVFREYAHKMDIIRMLTRVNQRVSTKKSATGQWMSHNKRQISSIVTQLRYELYLFPPHGPLKPYRSTSF